MLVENLPQNMSKVLDVFNIISLAGMYENLSSFNMSLKKKKGFVMVHKNVKQTTE